jgi:endonuclease/exonuclease/phosphatase family metal-dependent hydrolase
VLLRNRVLFGRLIREPTFLALALMGAGLLILFMTCLAGIVATSALGHGWWVLGVLACLLVWLLFGRRKPAPDDLPPTTRQAWGRRIGAARRWLLVGLLTVWLGLLGWLLVGPGGAMPPPKAEPTHLRVLTWNIHCGDDAGPPWRQCDWPARKHALKAVLDQTRPDVLCVQEALAGQLHFLGLTLPGHDRVGVGRDDGLAGGEHCAIFYDRNRFEQLDGDTFWLEGSSVETRFGIKRICTWLRLRDRVNGRTLRVYNTHLSLSEEDRLATVRVISGHVLAGDPTDAVVLTVDFNAGPDAPSRRAFADAGLSESTEHRSTFHFYGIPVTCLDGILAGPDWRVYHFAVLDGKPGGVFPSDHFGVLADLGFQ